MQVERHVPRTEKLKQWTPYLNILKNERTWGKTAVCLLSFLSSSHESSVRKGCFLPVLHFYKLVRHIDQARCSIARYTLSKMTEFSHYHCCDRALRRTWLRTFGNYIKPGLHRGSTHPTPRALRPLLPTAPCCLTSDSALTPFSLALRGSHDLD